MKITKQNAAKNVFYIIGCTFIIRLLIAHYTGLGMGESYYFRGALTIEWSYFDQPPLFFWLSWLSIKLFGITTLGLRFPAVLLFAGSSWLLFILTRYLFNAAAGFWAVVLMNLSAVFTISVAAWFQPDAPLIFFWLAAAYCFARVLDVRLSEGSTQKRNVYLWWTLTGVLMGLATLSKYHVLFLFAGVFLYVITDKNRWHWLIHPGPYLAVGITLLISFPVVWWNYQNNWASFVFQGSRAGADENFTLHPEWLLRSIAGQALWMLPWIWYPVVKQLFTAYKLRTTSTVYSFVFWTAVLPVVFFTVVTLWADLQYHFHWQAPGYMMLFMPLGYFINKALNSDNRQQKRVRQWLAFSVAFTVLTITVLSLHMVTGFWQAYGPKWLVSLNGDIDDPTIQGIDYEDIHTRFEKEGWMDNKKLFVGSPRWWLAGKVDWALKGKKDIVCFNSDPRNIAFLVDPKKLTGHDAVIIGQRHQENIDNDVKPFFDSVTQLPDINIVRNGIVELRLQVYYCKNFRQSEQERSDLPLYRQLNGQPPFSQQ
ncbi:hypothetical protein DJ568_00935 [Mucilaginibacter hurinus]|uniref:Glycosyltransferase RgtA/B/C/D-like domain-containing protein n=1 Tax=Mucilaginibacter hurinus TaxID=2201324 RepID=A0A367GUE5_9SPHI|nr:glycosyltransferase family 39 protein [Mucilaginibacter hurinus]RCH56456.1 hypothetical protein DJ568_00935 [Mucilaginibacter hurinus]